MPPTPMTQGKPRMSGHALYTQAFPNGHRIIPTPGTGNQCGLYALIRSMAAQHPGITQPTMEAFNQILQSDEMAEIINIIKSTGDADSTTENFLADHLAAIVQEWGRSYALDIVLAVWREPEAPLILDSGNVTPASIVVWIHNDNAADPEAGILGHYSGMEPKTAAAAAAAAANISLMSQHSPLTTVSSERGHLCLAESAPLNPPRPVGYYESRVAKAVGKATILRRVIAPSEEIESVDYNNHDPFAFVYDDDKLPIRPGRNYEPDVVSVPSWSRSIYKSELWSLQAKKPGELRLFCKLPAFIPNQNQPLSYTKEEAFAICRKLVDAINRWPDIDAISTATPTARMRPTLNTLFSAAQYSALPQKPVRGPQITLVKDRTNNRTALQVILRRIDPGTWTGQKVVYRVQSNQIRSEPPKAQNMVLGTIANRSVEDPGKDGHFASVILPEIDLDERRRSQLQREERFLWHLCSIWPHQCPVMTAPEAQARIDSEVKKLGLRNAIERKVYDGKMLIRLSDAVVKGGIGVLLGKAPTNDISCPLPIVRIQSPDFAWTRPVVDHCLSMWLKTSDILKTWVSVARLVDEVNERILAGEPSPSFCDCSPDMAAKTDHPCSRCGSTTVCKMLSEDPHGFRACEECLQKSFIPGTQRRAIYSLKNSVRREQRYIDGDRLGDIQSMLAIGREWITRKLQGQYGYSYVNAYSGAVIHQRGHGMRDPLHISCDAVFPISIGNKGKTMIHWADNISLIPEALNSCKHAHLPIFLETLAEYCRQVWPLAEASGAADLRAVPETQRLQEQLMADCSRFAYIRSKLPWTVRNRLMLHVSPQQLRYYKEEWVSGKVHPGSPLPRYRGHACRYSAWDGWSKSWTRISQVLREIEAWTGVELPKPGGCPYFAHPATIPEVWDRRQAFGLMEDRRSRMKTGCNLKWATVDNTETLFLECIFQCSLARMIVDDSDPECHTKRELQRKYAEFLGLPLAIESRHPLTFSVAHRVCVFCCHPMPFCVCGLPCKWQATDIHPRFTASR